MRWDEWDGMGWKADKSQWKNEKIGSEKIGSGKSQGAIHSQRTLNLIEMADKNES